MLSGGAVDSGIGLEGHHGAQGLWVGCVAQTPYIFELLLR